MKNRTTPGLLFAAIVISFVIGGGAGAIYFDGTNSTSEATNQTPTEQLEIAEKEVERITRQLKNLQGELDRWKDLGEEAVEELKETKKTLRENQNEVVPLKRTILVLEKRVELYRDRLTRITGNKVNDEPEIKKFRCRFRVGGKRKVKTIEAISISDAKKKIREQYSDVEKITIEEVETDKDD